MLLLGALFALFLGGFWLCCLVDVALTPGNECRGLPKAAWIVLVAATFVAGAVVWLAFRRPGWPTASPAARDGDDEPPRAPEGRGAALRRGVRADPAVPGRPGTRGGGADTAQQGPGATRNGPGAPPDGPGAARNGPGTPLDGPGASFDSLGSTSSGPGTTRDGPGVTLGPDAARNEPADGQSEPGQPGTGQGRLAGGAAGGRDAREVYGSLDAEAALLRHPAGRSRQRGAAQPSRPLGPDDDPDFLRSLSSAIHGADAGDDPVGPEEA